MIGVLSVALLAFSVGQETKEVEPTTIERWDRAVCLVTDGEKGKSNNDLASAFLVRDGQKVILVTARHAADDTKGRSRILFRHPNGEPRWVLLGPLSPNGGNPWQMHEESDLAITPLDLTNLDKYSSDALRALTIPIEALAVNPPPRTTAIEITGFPMGLGTGPQLSPLVFRGYLASAVLPAKTDWGKEPILYSAPVAGAGCSGGPVFLTKESVSDVSVIGMFIGMATDKTGAKLSKIVPASVVREMIASLKSDDAAEGVPAPSAN